MRWIALLLMVWSGVVLIGLLLVGPDMSPASGCLGLSGGPMACLEHLTAINDAHWRTQILPRLVVAIAGFVLIDLYGIWALRAHRRQAAAW